MPKDYYLANIRELLTEGFAVEELRRFCYDVSDFRPVYRLLAPNSRLVDIVDQLLEYAERKVKLDLLLTYLEKENPDRFEQHKPYYEETAPPSPVSSAEHADIQLAMLDRYLQIISNIHSKLDLRWYPSVGLGEFLLTIRVIPVDYVEFSAKE
jgi:hypothetical protein